MSKINNIARGVFYKPGHKPTPYDIGALADEGTVYFRGSRFIIDSGAQFNFTDHGYFLSYDEDTVTFNIGTADWTKGFNFRLKSDSLANFKVNGYKIYHEGNRPTWAEIGGSSPTITGSVLLPNGFLSIKNPVSDTTGGWARGIKCLTNTGGSNVAGIGFHGTGNGAPDRIYMGHGDTPWGDDQSGNIILTKTQLLYKGNYSFTGTGCVDTSHKYHNLYSSSDKSVYIHACPENFTENTITRFAFRTKGGTSYKELSVMGNGDIDWGGHSVFKTSDSGSGSRPALACLVSNTGGLNSAMWGVKGLQFAQFSGPGGSGANNQQFPNPNTDWWHHIVLNHNNNAGYYTQLATCFHNNHLAIRTVSSGSAITTSGSEWAWVYSSFNRPTFRDIEANEDSLLVSKLNLKSKDITLDDIFNAIADRLTDQDRKMQAMEVHHNTAISNLQIRVEALEKAARKQEDLIERMEKLLRSAE